MDWQQTREDLLKNSEVQHWIAEHAYMISQRRGFEGGHEIEDWLRAEHEVLEYLQHEYEAKNAEPHPAEALALVESAIHEEPVSRPLASDEISAVAPNDDVTPVKKKASKKGEKKADAAPKAKSESKKKKEKESKSVKTAAPKSKPVLKKASKKQTGISPSSETGD